MIGLKPPHLAPPILDWTGTTSGSQNMRENPILYFTTVGTYTITVRAPVTLYWEICGNGGYGTGGGVDVNGGVGGGCGEVRYAYVQLLPGSSYALVVQNANSGLQSYFALGGTVYVGAYGCSGTSAPSSSPYGTLIYAGFAGGGGGIFSSADPHGGSGSYAGGYAPGSGGGGGTSGSTVCGNGGDGGGNPGSGSPTPMPGGFAPGAGGGGGNGIGWRGFAVGYGGGGGASEASGGPWPSGGGAGPGLPGGGGGAVTSFVSTP